jgi:glycosyltransferase involved in cell wall biosynthesis
MRWYILTGEYPPAPGGVSDYTRQVAEGLAARGETVTVCAPAGRDQSRFSEKRNGVNIQWLPGHFRWRGLGALRTYLNGETPGGRLLVQYVPHAFGWKAMNVPLCAWLAAQRRQTLWIMFHEVAYPLEPGQPWSHQLLARVNRWMARRLATRAERVFVSTTAWLPILQSICRRAIPVDWAAIPSNFETPESGEAAASSPIPGKGTGPMLAHFGTFSPWIVRRLGTLIPAILGRCPEAGFALLGRGSEAFANRLRQEHPALGTRIFGVGDMSRATVPAALAACDLLIQPYPDGINTRRTSAMCGLALSRPVITQTGANSESIWRESGGVHLVESDDPEHWATAVRRLLDVPTERHDLGARGGNLYWTRFSLEKTLDLLLGHPTASREEAH